MGSPSIISNPMFNMGFLLVSMQLAKKVDWENPDVLTYARIGYYSAQVLVVALAYGLMAFIKKKNGKSLYEWSEMGLEDTLFLGKRVLLKQWMTMESQRMNGRLTGLFRYYCINIQCS